MKVVICAIAKFEYNYIKEWVEYHLDLGFDKIVIYDNNDLDGERYDELLSEFIEKGQVELRDVRGKLAMQRVVYNEFYHEGDFDWVANIDIDEFISPNRTKYKSIKEFLVNHENSDAIYLYWQTYGDAGKTYPTKSTKPVSILKQYSVPANKYSLIDNALKRQNSWGKSIIKKGLPVKYLHEHFVVEPEINYTDCFGKHVYPGLFWPDMYYVESSYKECYIKHIYTKSLYEYIDCKVRRPAANCIGEMHFPSKYFKVNEINEEKRKYLESIGYKMEFVFKPDVYFIIELRNLSEYEKVKPYIMNVINMCSCRLNLCITEDETAVPVIQTELNNLFNECNIFFHNKPNVLSDFCTVFFDDRENVVNHSNCIIHLNIPYGVNIYEYISTFIDPVFNEQNLKQNFMRLFNSENCLYVSDRSIAKIDTSDTAYTSLAQAMIENGYKFNLEYAAFTGNFIAKTKDVLKWKDAYYKVEDLVQDPNVLLYFISNMFDNLIYSK